MLFSKGVDWIEFIKENWDQRNNGLTQCCRMEPIVLASRSLNIENLRSAQQGLAGVVKQLSTNDQLKRIQTVFQKYSLQY